MKRPIVPVPALLAATALASIGPPSANAGVYRAAVCNPALAALHPDAIFARTSRHYLSDASCGEGQAGLAVRHQGKRTGQGRWGGWTVRAPRGTVISHLGVSAAGRRAGGHVPQLLTAPLAGPLQPFSVPDPGMERSRWNGRARSFVARLGCARDGGCGSGDRSGIRVKRLSLRMADRARPTIALSGRAFGPGSKRGIQAMQAIASDVGAGIHRFLLQVNGEPVAAHASWCRADRGFRAPPPALPPSRPHHVQGRDHLGAVPPGAEHGADLHGRLRPGHAGEPGLRRAPCAGRQPLPDLERRPRTRARGSHLPHPLGH